MTDERSGYKHDASDKKLDKSAEVANDGGDTHDTQHSSGGGHDPADTRKMAGGNDPAETRKHDDAGKDRLFEGRQQHDAAEKNSEKTRLARDIDAHHHTVDDDVADAGTGESAKRKS